MLRPSFEPANPEGMTIPHCVKTADEVFAILKGQYARWQDLGVRQSGEGNGEDLAPCSHACCHAPLMPSHVPFHDPTAD